MRPIDPLSDAEIAVVADRMRLTLIEVVGAARGGSMYTPEWLRARVRFHLDPNACEGAVFVATQGGMIVGHTIVRVEHEDGARFGLFSTTYVDPAHRRHGVAEALLDRGEAWLGERRVDALVTDTSQANAKLIALFQKRGYAVVFRSDELGMLRLSRPVSPRADRPSP